MQIRRSLSPKISLLLILLILVVALRSLKVGLVSMIPNLVPAAMGFGIWGLFVGEVEQGPHAHDKRLLETTRELILRVLDRYKAGR